MRTKAYRRWQEQKKKKKVRKYFVCERHGDDGVFDYSREPAPTNDPAIIGIVARTPAACSCYMCGNPRKHWNELTMQEKRAAEVDEAA